jgi:hypothetical protein
MKDVGQGVPVNIPGAGYGPDRMVPAKRAA